MKVARRSSRLVLMALLAGLATPAPAEESEVARGKDVFRTCAACHALEPGEHRVGPSLHGIFGRTAGSVAEFDYSPAMAAAGFTWSAETLDAYIANPYDVVPGNRMPFGGLSDSRARKALIAYLKKAARD